MAELEPPASEKSGPVVEDEGKSYGDYQVLKPIGKGKFAVVYRAQRKSDNLICALKRINVDIMDDKARDKTLKEVRLLQSLDHPNIIRYLDSFISENDLVIIVEWAAAGDLKRQLRKAQERGVGFEERTIWKYFSQICDAMKHMHDRRIMHRDLKPANIFLTLDGTVKVGDLGLSRELSEHTVQAHSKVGTPLYMSPEVLRGDGYDFKSDIWSLGCLLYELAMLKSPFKSEGLNLYSLFQKISQGEYQPLPENYSEELRVLAYAMISTNAEDRPEIGEVCMRASKMRAATASKRGSTSSQGASSSSSSSGGAGGERGDDEGREEKGGAGPVSASSGGSVSGSDGARQVSVAAAVAKHDDAPGGRGDKGYDDGRDDRARHRDRDRDQDRDRGREEKMPQDRIDRDGDSRTDSSRRPSFRQDGDDNGDGHGHSHSSKNGFKTAARAVDGGEQRGSRQSSAGASDEPPRGSKDRPTGRPGGGDDSEDAEATQVNVRLYNAPGSGAEPNGGARRPSDREKRDKDKEKDKGGLGQPVYYPYNRDAESEKKSRTPEMKPYSRPKQLSPSAAAAAAAGGGAPRAGSGGHGSDAQARQEPRKSTDARAGGRGPERDLTGPVLHPDDGDADLVDAGGDGRRGSVARKDGKAPISSVALALMDALYSHLVVLQYPMRGVTGTSGVLLPMHFAGDANNMGKIAGATGVGNTQFRRMAEVATWLCVRAGGAAVDAAMGIDVTRDAPLMVAKQLLAAAGHAGVPAQDLADILPTALIAGHGEKVCTLLLALCARALAAAKHTWLPLKYSSFVVAAGSGGSGSGGGGARQYVEEDEQLEVDEDGDGGAGAGEDDGLLQEVDEAEAVFGGGGGAGGDDGDRDGLGDSAAHPLGASMVLPTADAAKWREETERVVPRLVAAAAARRGGRLAGDWADHITAMRDYARGLPPADPSASRAAPDARRDGGPNPPAAAGVDGLLPEHLRGLVAALAAQTQAMARAENVLNGRDTVRSLGEEYSTHKRALDGLRAAAAATTARLDALSQTEAEVDEKLDEAREGLDGKMGGGDGAGDGGTASVLRLKESIKQLKADTVEMTARTGVLAATLLRYRVRDAAHANAQRRQKQQRAKRGGKTTRSAAGPGGGRGEGFGDRDDEDDEY